MHAGHECSRIGYSLPACPKWTNFPSKIIFRLNNTPTLDRIEEARIYRILLGKIVQIEATNAYNLKRKVHLWYLSFRRVGLGWFFLTGTKREHLWMRPLKRNLCLLENSILQYSYLPGIFMEKV